MDNLTKRVIDWINEFNKHYGGGGIFPVTTMPYGIPKDCDSCPIANATGWEVHPSDLRNGDNESVHLPAFVQEWIHKFDNLEYPEYDEMELDYEE